MEQHKFLSPKGLLIDSVLYYEFSQEEMDISLQYENGAKYNQMSAIVIIVMQFSSHFVADDCFIAFLKLYYFSKKVAESNGLNTTLTLDETIK